MLTSHSLQKLLQTDQSEMDAETGGVVIVVDDGTVYISPLSGAPSPAPSPIEVLIEKELDIIENVANSLVNGDYDNSGDGQ